MAAIVAIRRTRFIPGLLVCRGTIRERSTPGGPVPTPRVRVCAGPCAVAPDGTPARARTRGRNGPQRPGIDLRFPVGIAPFTGSPGRLEL
ncbi:hypothetical protein GCM10010507_29160 [Streptomyces cinnamoneus]|uniref:Uncharacterized protein n=1 Tax=Streptomyces cinnamoneus TaxID=53446 RepID=A0A918TPR0_STRCJ|nr:hypothetical protein GCM10010507_29160 [Streptomyces cinnamoneus]